MTNYVELDIPHLRECFDYDPETGVITWKVRPLSHFRSKRSCNTFNTTFGGKPADKRDHRGYIRIGISRHGHPSVRHRAHRIAWALYYGEVPTGFIDHINMDRADNRIVNLRPCTNKDNCSNTGMRPTNKTGFKGVSIKKGHGSRPFCAQITANQKRIHLGYFATAEEAHHAFCEAAKKHHGDFANFGR
jgi:hypothetical protein